jgi:hypothetical protein
MNAEKAGRANQRRLRAWGKLGNCLAEGAAHCIRALRVELGGLAAWERVGIQAGLSKLLLAWKSLEMSLPPLAKRGIRG